MDIYVTHFAAAHYKDFLALNLPCENKAATALDFWKFLCCFTHVQEVSCKMRHEALSSMREH